MLGGSWVVISGVISRVTIHIRALITLLITTDEPPSGFGSEHGTSGNRHKLHPLRVQVFIILRTLGVSTGTLKHK